jgi:threonine/homoserine/homoserine lactone efflux protein
MSAQSLLLYFTTWLLLALTPGPAVICVISQATRYGWQAGFRGVLGIQLGNFVFFLCIAFGLIALLSTAMHAFVILQLARRSLPSVSWSSHHHHFFAVIG